MSSLVELRREGDVFILSMNHGDNRISKRLADELNAHLDTVERFSCSFIHDSLVFCAGQKEQLHS